MEIWEPKTPGTLWATLGLLGIPLPLPLHILELYVFETVSKLFSLVPIIVANEFFPLGFRY